MEVIKDLVVTVLYGAVWCCVICTVSFTILDVFTGGKR